jgi:predicted nucleotidyltransferase
MKIHKLNEIKDLLGGSKSQLKTFKVQRLRVFGSTARGENINKSDLDIIVDYENEARTGFFEFLELQYFLEALFECKVDLATEEALHPALKERILGEAVNVA